MVRDILEVAWRGWSLGRDVEGATEKAVEIGEEKRAGKSVANGTSKIGGHGGGKDRIILPTHINNASPHLF